MDTRTTYFGCEEIWARIGRQPRMYENSNKPARSQQKKAGGRALRAVPTVSAKGAGKQRMRFGSLPKPPEHSTVPYALCRDEFQGSLEAQQLRVVLESPQFEAVIGAKCDAIDAERGRTGGKRGTQPHYTARQLEAVFVYQWLLGLRSSKEARDRIAGDRGKEVRELLGFDRPCKANPNPRVQRLLQGVPSEPTLSRHKHRIGPEVRMKLYEELFDRVVADHMQDPKMREETRLIGIDGTKIETHYTCPKRDRKTGKVVNAKLVTCPDGGFVGRGASADKSGHGYNALLMTTFSGLPLSYEITPLHHGEPTTAARVIEKFDRMVNPHLDPHELRVLSGDGAFHSEQVRRAARNAGLVENIHPVSHGDSDRSRRNAAKADKRRLVIQDYPNWAVNGHYELICSCGAGKTSKDVKARPGKTPTIRVSGTCERCGPITITSGRWRKVKNVNGKSLGFTRILPGEEHEADHALGNPLTYNDPIAGVYGLKRFGHCEGFHGSLVSRFSLLKGKRWIRSVVQPRTELALIGSITHLLAMEQRRLAAAGTTLAASTGPPGLAEAA